MTLGRGVGAWSLDRRDFPSDETFAAAYAEAREGVRTTCRELWDALVAPAAERLEGKKRVIIIPGHDNLESPIIEKKNAQVLSAQGDTANVMDSESYETFDLKIPEELKGKAAAGVVVSYWVIMDDKVMKQVQGGA